MPLFSKKITPTEITTLVEKATTNVEELDWALVFQICDKVNSTELGAKEARKLLQKKMLSTDPKVQVLSLEILNSLAENSTVKFQPQLAAKSFGEDLHTLASSKTLDDGVHGKLVQCLSTWNNQFGADPNFGTIRRSFDTLMNGVTPSHRRPLPTNQNGGSGSGSRNHASSMPRHPPQPRDVNGDIELAKNSAQLFSQTVSFTDPTKEDISKNELIQEFYGKCKQSQQLLASHLETCEDSDVISALINANNELLSCFKSYDEMLEQHAVNQATVNSQTLHNRTSRHDEQQQQQQQQQQSTSSSNNPYEELLSTDNHYAAAAASSSKAPQSQFKPSDDPFDPFADTNQVQITTTTTDDSSSTAAGNTTSTTVLPPPLTPQRTHNE